MRRFLAVAGGIVIMFWNLENFFDYHDDGGGAADTEFSAAGDRHWTGKRFYTKCDAVAKAILRTGTEEGRMPDIMAFAEVENARVLRKLIRDTALEKLDYKAVHYDSPDRRGIDVGLIYDKARLRLLRSKPCRVTLEEDTTFHTRDILLAEFSIRDSPDSFAVLVNHHPSKYGGERISVPRRAAAVRRLAFLADSLERAGYREIIACGDFNDTPDNPLYESLPLLNISLPLHRKGEGTIRFEGKWELIDLFFVSEALREKAEMKILRIPFLMTRDKKYEGEKPFRTYSGPKYTGGVSDHCPILLRILRDGTSPSD